MRPDQALASLRRQISMNGETVTVRRYSGAGPSRSHVDTDTMARVAAYRAQDLIGEIVQGDRHVIALVDTLAAVLPLSTFDKIVIRGKECAIKSVDDDTRRIAGVLIGLDIQVEG
jgi:hypothetical protein